MGKKPYAYVLMTRRLSDVQTRFGFEEAVSEDEMRRVLMWQWEASVFPSCGWSLEKIYIMEIPQDFIDKFASKLPRYQEGIRAVISDEDRGLKTPLVDR